MDGKKNTRNIQHLTSIYVFIYILINVVLWQDCGSEKGIIFIYLLLSKKGMALDSIFFKEDCETNKTENVV